MKVGRYLLVIMLAVGAVVAVRLWKGRHSSSPAQGAAPLPAYDDSAYSTRAPDSVHIKVEVLNATKSRGLARHATLYLRDRGFDVVMIGTARGGGQKETVVLDRSDHPAWARLVAKAMRGRVVERPDTSLYLDATVLVGSDWTPPPQPFYP